jgi:hypothetical protein
MTAHAGKRRSTAELTPYLLPSRFLGKANPMRHEEPIMAADLAEQEESTTTAKSRDQDKGKGAVEQDQNNEGGNTNMTGQLGHRDEDAELKDADSDLPG